METQVDVDKVSSTTWKRRSLLSSETTHLALHQWTPETLHQDRHRHQVLAVPVRVPRQVHTEGRTVIQTLSTMSTRHDGDKIGTLVMSTHQEVQLVSCTVCRKAQGRAKVELSMASATSVGSQVIQPSSVMQKVEKQKGKKGDSKGWSDSKGWRTGKGWSESKGWNTSDKGWEQQRPAGMNTLERDSKQYDVLVRETSTQENTVIDSDWRVPVKHVAKLCRMRGSTSTKTNIKFFFYPEEDDRDNDTRRDGLGSKQFALEDNDSYKCSCCEANGMQWKRTQNLAIKKPRHT